MNVMSIKGLAIITKIGIYEWEKTYEQKVIIDVKIKYDYRKYKNLEKYLDYDEIVSSILLFSKNRYFSLLEQMSEELAEAIISKFKINWIKITIHKPNAIPYAKDVSITLEKNI